jgi:large subunit ribosomal protein L6
MLTIEIPANVQMEIKENEITTKGSLGSNSRKFNDALLKVTKDGNKVTITGVTHKVLAHKANMATISFAKELKNDIEGVNKHYEFNMQVIFAHFPITVEVKGDMIMIKNLIGERAARTAKIVGETKIEIKGQNIRVYGTSLDDASQTAANMRRACKIREKDGRIFQDGIYFALE